MATIALVTYRGLPQLTSEDQLLCSFLQTLGVKTQAIIWDAPDVAWESYQAMVFRFFHKQFSHAVLKKAKPGDFRVQDDFGGTVEVVSPGMALIDQAQQIINCIKGPLLFARVDGIELDGRLVLMELELIEPFLFLNNTPHAVERFAHAILNDKHT